jgi:pyruvate dehydrogenase E2 component (dihydrolipoamide acetyltransferase)
MATALRMPRWGMIMEEGTLHAWKKKEGDAVSQGEPVAEAESEKAVNEVEAPASGVLARILVAEGVTVPVGGLLAVIRAVDEPEEAVQALLAAETRSAAPAAPGAPAASASRSQGIPPAPTSPGDEKRRLGSPAARHIAAEAGIDWRNLPGSGPGGRVQAKDVRGATPGAMPRGLSPLRTAIARTTLLSIQAPQAALCREIDMTALLALRAASRKDAKGKPPSLTALLVQQAAAALREVPVLNSRLLPQGHLLGTAIHMGIVVSTDGGIMIPVIRNVQELGLAGIDRAIADFVRRAGQKSIRPEETEGGTFTVSNAGPLGVDIFQPLLNPPQAAILGVGQIRSRAVVVDGRVAARQTAFFCLSTDHRVIDAEPAGEFLRLLERLIAGTDRPLGR